MVDHFSEFDIDHDGAISRADLAIVMQSLGSAADAETLTTMISQVVGGDVTDASTITFKDYAAHMAKKWTPGRPPTVTPGALPEDAGGQFKRVFDIIDRDRDGKITQADVDHFVKLWGDEWSRRVVSPCSSCRHLLHLVPQRPAASTASFDDHRQRGGPCTPQKTQTRRM